MIRRGLLACVAALVLTGAAGAAEIRVKIAPPRARVEKRIAAPGRGYVWTSGYQRWDGRAYVWVPGQWLRPPRPRARWVAPHWVKSRGEWVFIEGRWR